MDLDETFLSFTDGTVQSRERLIESVILDTFLIKLPRIHADMADLRLCVSHPRQNDLLPADASEEQSVAHYRSCHHVRVVSELGSSARISLSFLPITGSSSAVTHSKNISVRSLHLVIVVDAISLTELHSCRLESHVVDIGLAACGEKNQLNIDLLFLTIFGDMESHLRKLLLLGVAWLEQLNTVCLSVHDELASVCSQLFEQNFSSIAILPGQEVRSSIDKCYISTEALEGLAQFGANRSRSNDSHSSRLGNQVPNIVRSVELDSVDAGNRGNIRSTTCGDASLVERQCLSIHFNSVPTSKFGITHVHIDSESR